MSQNEKKMDSVFEMLKDVSNLTTKGMISGLAYHMACATYNFLYNTKIGEMYIFSDPPYIHMASIPVFELIIKEGWEPINPLVKKITVSASNFMRVNSNGTFVNALLNSEGKVIDLIEHKDMHCVFSFLNTFVKKKETWGSSIVPKIEKEKVIVPKIKKKKRKWK